MQKSITCSHAAEMIPDGASILVGGFMGCGCPERVLAELVKLGRKNLTIISNDATTPGHGIDLLLQAKAVKKMIATHIGLNPEAQRQMIAGEMEVELCPQGTFAERIRAAGYGLGGVLTPTGFGTIVADGKPTVEVDGKKFLLEKPIHADFALVSAHRSDYLGNLEYSLTERNFNQVMAMAANTVIAVPDHIVPTGVIPPDVVATPFVVVDYIVEGGAL
jgi:acetate CoA/acetoacetate CoA-transferase alpha subunit